METILVRFIINALKCISGNQKAIDLNGAKIQYQQVDICESTEGVRTFSGYIHLPVDSLQAVGLDQHLPINTFFWFAESRTKRDNVPLILYLNGGPGVTTSFLRENGPCRVNADSRTTRLNPWSWNSESNILFLDQPVNTGFSFDVPVNGTINFRGEKSPQMPQFTQNSRLIEAATIGIGSINSSHTINNTNGAVRAIWLSLSTWLQDFTPLSSKRNELGIWTASYGGHYAPALYDFTMSQNRAKAESTSLLTSQVPRIRITSIGLANACVDAATQIPTYFEMAYNNTYGLRLINESSYRSAKLAWDSPGGCKEQIEDCRRAANSIQYLGNNASANTICHNANTFCGKHIANIVSSSGRNIFDIGQRTHFLSDPTLHTYLGYLRQDEVQRALGVPVNFTDHAIDIAHAFAETGDNLLGDYLASLGRALDDGVKVSLMYGDRDYACNSVVVAAIADG
ncbi:hypothetical protein UA08_01255 [Talaromyces atroroseus]|uniref:Uncharacterized protein n=1 Tax=Talaromyces atroroseus TaxID=1441469 RepID=A0A1Q5QBH3_TALAT|nr:hypothetical protein UA08_01255 [Talaromyces atroroseus]OKL63119.1 hypothetical protein UA08_01255 [Talaromyces atroroseus]